MVIPLGLGYIPKRFAFMTIILVVMNFFFFESNRYDNAEASIRIKELGERYKVDQIVQHAFLTQCAQKFEHIKCYMFIHPDAKKPAQEKPVAETGPKVEVVHYKGEKPSKKDIEEERKKEIETLAREIAGTKQKVSVSEAFQMNQIYFEAQQLDKKTYSFLTAQSEQDNFNNYHTEVAKIHRNFQLLSGYDLTPQSILKALFSHGDIWHLVTNMLVLLMFGTYVELKIGSLIFGCLYVALGFFSALVATKFQNPLMYCVGASGAIFGVLAMYYTLFYKDFLKLKVFFLLYNKTVYVRNATWFPLIFLMSETIQGIGANSQFWYANGISHLTHAGGAIFGFGIALVWKNFLSEELHEGFHFDFQLQDWVAALATNSYINMLALAQYLLHLNPNNFSLKESLLKRYNQYPQNIKNPELQVFIHENFKQQLVHEFKLKNSVKTIWWIGEIQKANMLEDIFVTMDANTILAIGNYLVAYKKYEEALLFYGGYIQKYPTGPITPSIKETVINVQKLVPNQINIRKIA